MTLLKRAAQIAPVLAVVALLTACSPQERFLFAAWSNKNPVASQAAIAHSDPAHLLDEQPALTDTLYKALWDAAHAPASVPAGGSGCASYDQMIDVVGLPYHFHTVMRRESGCNPRAHNPSGASGLMQVMPMWAGECGGTYSDLYDPWFNIRCAVHIYDVSGGGAWSTW